MIRILRAAVAGITMVEDAAAWDACDEPERMLPLLNQFPGDRRPRLLACAFLRYAPFDLTGKPVWELLPGYRWFELPCDFQNLVMAVPQDLTIGGVALTCHSLVELVEARADCLVENDHWEIAKIAASRAEWAAEADTFFEDRPEFVGSRFRDGIAYYLCHITRDDVRASEHHLIKFLLLYKAWILQNEPGSIHADNGSFLASLIRDLYGNPFRPIPFRRDWTSETVRNLARTIDEGHAFDLMPVLGDALEEAGCDDRAILDHCRGGAPHARGCWVVDVVNGRESLPPFDPGRVVSWDDLLGDWN